MISEITCGLIMTFILQWEDQFTQYTTVLEHRYLVITTVPS